MYAKITLRKNINLKNGIKLFFFLSMWPAPPSRSQGLGVNQRRSIDQLQTVWGYQAYSPSRATLAG